MLSRLMGDQGKADIIFVFFVFPRGTVDVGRLRRAATALSWRHAALRGTFTIRRMTPVLTFGTPSAEVERVPVAPGRSTHETVRDALSHWPADGPVLRLLLTEGPEPDEELLAVALDHAAGDEAALDIVTAGLTEWYADAPDDETLAGLVARPSTDASDAYRAAVLRQLETEGKASTAAHLAHWAERLRDLPGPGRPAWRTPGTGPETGDGRPRPEAGMLTCRLAPVPERARGRLFPALLDALGEAVRQRPDGDGTGVLGYPWGGRPAGTPDILGCFINTLAHPVGSGAAGLDAVTDDWWDDLDHADTPFDQVLHTVRGHSSGWNGALTAGLTFENVGRRPPLVLGGVAGRETHIALRPTSTPLAVSASHGDDLLIRLVWDRALVREDDARQAFDTVVSTYRSHLESAVPRPVI
ncbi:non-ribosomal peptide synthetase [Actinacidiphila glaucinigra]